MYLPTNFVKKSLWDIKKLAKVMHVDWDKLGPLRTALGKIADGMEGQRLVPKVVYNGVLRS